MYGYSMNLSIDSFYSSTYELSQLVVSENPFASLQEKQLDLQDEKQAITFIRDSLSKARKERTYTVISQPANGIDHALNLLALQGAVQTLKKTYQIKHAHACAVGFFQKIAYFFKRYQVAWTARCVNQLLEKWLLEDINQPFKIGADLNQIPKAEEGGYERLSGVEIKNITLVNSSFFNGSNSNCAVGVSIPDSIRLFKNSESDGERGVQIGKQLFVCRTVSQLEQGTWALTSKQYQDLMKSHSFLNSYVPVSFMAQPLKPSERRISSLKLDIQFIRSYQLEFVDKKEMKKMIINQLKGRYLKIGNSYDIKDQSVYFSCLVREIKIAYGLDLKDEMGVLENTSRISLLSLSPLLTESCVFKNLSLNNSEDLIFSFSLISRNPDHQSRIKADDFIPKLKQVWMERDRSPLNLKQIITLPIEGQRYSLRLEQVEVKNSLTYLSTNPEVKNHLTYLSTNPKDSFYNFKMTDQSEIQIKDPQSEALEIKSKNRDFKSKEMQPNPPTLQEYLAQEGIVGLPKELDDVTGPIIAAHGPLRHIMKERGLLPERGILLYGPPGTGKTSFARLFAQYLGLLGIDNRVQMLSATSLVDSFVGGTEKAIRELIKPALEASQKLGEKSPLYLVVMDEIDSLLGSRETCNKNESWKKDWVNQFLTAIDGFERPSNLLIIGITNQKNALDSAALRSGRLGTHIEIGIPNREERQLIWNVHLKKLKEQQALAQDLDWGQLLDQTDGFCGAHIEGAVRMANRLAFNRLKKAYENDEAELELLQNREEYKIFQQDFEQAIQEMRKQITQPNRQS